jgi:hypothetical protein
MNTSRDPIETLLQEIDELRRVEQLVEQLEHDEPHPSQLRLHALALSRLIETRDRLRSQPERTLLSASLLEVLFAIGGYPRLLEWARENPAEALELGIIVPQNFEVKPK